MAGLAPELVDKIAANCAHMGASVRGKHGQPGCYVVVPNRKGARPITFGPSQNYKEAEQLLVRLRRAGLDKAMRDALGMPAKRPSGKIDASLIDALEFADLDGNRWLEPKPLPDDIAARSRQLSARYTVTPYALERLSDRNISLFEAYAALLMSDYTRESNHHPRRILVFRGDICVCLQDNEKVITVYDLNSLMRSLEGRPPRVALLPPEAVRPISPAPSATPFLVPSKAPAPDPLDIAPRSAPPAPPTVRTRTGKAAQIDASMPIIRALVLVLTTEYNVGDEVNHRDLLIRLRIFFGSQLVSIHPQLAMAQTKYKLVRRIGPGRYVCTEPPAEPDPTSTLAREAEQKMATSSTGRYAVLDKSMSYKTAVRNVIDIEYATGDEVTRAALVKRVAKTHSNPAGVDNALAGLKHQEHRLIPKSPDQPGVYLVQAKGATVEIPVPRRAEQAKAIPGITLEMSATEAIEAVLRAEYAVGMEVRPIKVIGRVLALVPVLTEVTLRSAFKRIAETGGLMTHKSHGVYILDRLPADAPDPADAYAAPQQPDVQEEAAAVDGDIVDDPKPASALPVRSAVPAQRRAEPEFVFELDEEAEPEPPTLTDYIGQFMPLAIKLRDGYPGQWATLMRLPSAGLPGDLDPPDGVPMALSVKFLPTGEVKARWDRL